MNTLEAAYQIREALHLLERFRVPEPDLGEKLVTLKRHLKQAERALEGKKR